MRKGLLKFVYILRCFSFREKVLFSSLAIIFTISLIIFLWRVSDTYSRDVPAPGGSLREGIIGTPRFINPLLAVSDADRDLTALIYSGLMRPDQKSGLIPDLAESYIISPDGLTYTFTLRPELFWQDGKPLTTDDIIFTIQQAKDSQLKSPKRANWEGVSLEKVDDRVIRFILSRPYAPFLENTTLGILPKHLWEGATADKMNFSYFNINPVGSGPYMIKKINRNSSGIITSYELVPFEKFALGKPLISSLNLHFYQSAKEIISAFQKGEIEIISALNSSDLEKVKRSNVLIKTLYLPRVFGVFFNHNNARIFTQKEVREALNLAVDKERIIDEVLQGFGIRLDYPIPPGVFGAVTDGTNSFSEEGARETLRSGGWIFNDKDNIWEKTTGTGAKKETVRLEFSLATSDTPDLKQTAELLRAMWEKIGARVNLRIFETGDLNQNVIRPRKYDALLFGEVVGRNPDPFAFWHSSQRNDPGLNIAMYTNATVDKLLEGARATSSEEAQRKYYQEFQKELVKDTPAIFLFSPQFIYLVPNYIKGMEEAESIVVPSERFAQVYKWYIKTDHVWKIFVP
jgi:peptide/nickel transport system substrate-binding protein